MVCLSKDHTTASTTTDVVNELAHMERHYIHWIIFKFLCKRTMLRLEMQILSVIF